MITSYGSWAGSKEESFSASFVPASTTGSRWADLWLAGETVPEWPVAVQHKMNVMNGHWIQTIKEMLAAQSLSKADSRAKLIVAAIKSAVTQLSSIDKSEASKMGEVLSKLAKDHYSVVAAKFSPVRASSSAKPMSYTEAQRAAKQLKLAKASSQAVSQTVDLVGSLPGVATPLEEAFPAPIENSETLEPLVAGVGGVAVDASADGLFDETVDLSTLPVPQESFMDKLNAQPMWVKALGALVVVGGGYYLLKR